MPACSEVVCPIEDSNGRVTGSITISLLPDAMSPSVGPPLLIEDPDDREAYPVQLLEGAEYRYEIRTEEKATPVRTDRPEIVQRDTEAGVTGRLKPGVYTGSLPLTIFSGDAEIGCAFLEVRARKLDYRNEYRWMLRDLAETLAEIVMRRFAATEASFEVDASRDAQTVYQQFAFLSSLLSDDNFLASLHQIITRPYVRWEAQERQVHPGRGLKGSSELGRQIARAGPRVKWREFPGSLPRQLVEHRTEVTVDNIENRFVKHVLERWRNALADILGILEAQTDSPPVARGIRECGHVVDSLDAFLAEELFRELGPLTAFPVNNQVLQRRPGYRDLYRAFFEFEVASKLSWKGGEQVYSAGQRDVATLYEYWVFLQLAAILSDLIDVPFDMGALIELSGDKLNVALRQGHQLVLHGHATRYGRRVSVDFWYNKSFSARTSGQGSWTRSMRPDYSLRFRPEGYEGADEIWVHFDAKYRLANLVEAFGSNDSADGDSESVSKAAPLRDDLLKMHAYRDAIHRSSGAYVLYPGDTTEVCCEYHELLPGLGAFGLRPANDGEAQGKSAVKEFLVKVLDHLANQLSQHERGRFWARESFADSADLYGPPTQPVKFLERPAADTLVLLGYVKNKAHRDWILRTGLYNLRADNRRGAINLDSNQLGAEFAILYTPTERWCELFRISGPPSVRRSEELDGYPNPGGKMYICLGVNRMLSTVPDDTFMSVGKLAELSLSKTSVLGAPTTVTWAEALE